MRTTYVNDGKLVGDIVRGNIAGFASEVLDLEKGDAIVAAGVSVDGAIVEVRFSTKNGYDFTVGFSAGDSYDFEVPSENDGELFEVIAFQGSYNDECLTTFSAYYQLVDACSCDEDLLRNNNFCDGKCYNKLCGYDWDECPKECSCDASLTLIFNGVCDLDCNNESCNFDNGACPVDGCDICDEELKNDECDLKCNTKECNYDNGKCKPGCDCHPDMLGDG